MIYTIYWAALVFPALFMLTLLIVTVIFVQYYVIQYSFVLSTSVKYITTFNMGYDSERVSRVKLLGRPTVGKPRQ